MRPQNGDRASWRVLLEGDTCDRAAALEAEKHDLIGDRLPHLLEVAFALGVVAPNTVKRHVARPDFPAPVDRGRYDRRIWHRSDVEAWGRAHIQPPVKVPEKRNWRPMLRGTHWRGLSGKDEAADWLRANDPTYFDDPATADWRQPGRLKRASANT